MKLTHIDENGKARMVDVSGKTKTRREAIACGKVTMGKTTYELVRKGDGPKGDIFNVAKIAGIMAAKQTHALIPLCHPIALSHVDVEYAFHDDSCMIEIITTVRTDDRTGVEMEALTCAMLTALTIYDMCKAVDKSVEMGPFYLLGKKGGKSGEYRRAPEHAVSKRRHNHKNGK